jgi:hypothetical protein
MACYRDSFTLDAFLRRKTQHLGVSSQVMILDFRGWVKEISSLPAVGIFHEEPCP